MADYRQQQIEALEMVYDYTGKLIPAMEEVCAELAGAMQGDTIDYLMQIIDAFNFVIETYNVTKDLINEDGAVVDEKELETTVGKLSKALLANDYPKAGTVMRSSVIDFLKVLNKRAEEVTNN